MLLIWCVCLPRWVVINMHREYRAVMIMLNPRRVIEGVDQDNVDMITSNSPTRLMVGGRVRLVRLASSHQVVIRGGKVCRPRARVIVWLCTRS